MRVRPRTRLLPVGVRRFADGVRPIAPPDLLATFVAVRRHYDAVAREIANPQPLDVASLKPPIVIIPMREWNKMSQTGLRFALELSPEVYVVQIRTGDPAEADLDRP